MKLRTTRREDKYCERCRHFHQHYAKAGRETGYLDEDNGYFSVFCGHCDFPRIKERGPYDTCRFFEEKEE